MAGKKLGALEDFLAPLRECEAEGKEMPLSLFRSLLHYVWDPDLLRLPKPKLARVHAHLQHLYFNTTPQQTDISDMLDWKPVELLSAKLAQALLSIILHQHARWKEELESLRNLLQDPRVAQEGGIEAAFLFLQHTLVAFAHNLASSTGAGGTERELADFESLNPQSRAVIQAASVHFMKLFKMKSMERVAKLQQVLKEDPSSVEYHLMLGEMLRLRRRDCSGGNKGKRWMGQEELELLGTALGMSPDNPFVRLALIDTLIGNVRDSSGRFYLGHIKLDTLEDSMQFLIENCLALVSEYPRNLFILTTISDYFARYFPFLYFDADESRRILQMAYDINSNNPRVTHRFGILTRMSFANLPESTHWLKKTVSLDPTFFPGLLEYYKSIIGREEGVAERMSDILSSELAEGWSDLETSEFLFFTGIAYFHAGAMDQVVERWMRVTELNEVLFKLEELLVTAEHFQWDQKKIGVDPVRAWIQKERGNLTVLAKEGKPFDSKKREFVDRLFGILLGTVTPRRTVNAKHEMIVRYFPQNLLTNEASQANLN